MQGMHVFDPLARTVIDLESFVAKDPLLRKVDRVLDLSFVRDLYCTGPKLTLTRSASDELSLFLACVSGQCEMCQSWPGGV